MQTYDSQFVYFYAMGYFDGRTGRSVATMGHWHSRMVEAYYKGYNRGIFDRVPTVEEI